MQNSLLSRLFPGMGAGMGTLGLRAKVLMPPAAPVPAPELPTLDESMTLMERARIAAMNEMAALQNPKPQAASKSNTLLSGFGGGF